MSHVARALTILSLALAAWLIVFAVGKSSEATAIRRTIAEQKEANAAIVEAVYREKRADSLKYARIVAQARSAERKMAARLDGVLTNAGLTVDSARAVLADSMAPTVALRYSLTLTVEKLDAVVREARVYRTSAEARFAADSAERVYLRSLVTDADGVIAAKNLAIEGWRKAADCRILWMRCPTRTQAALGGALITFGVVMAVR